MSDGVLPALLVLAIIRETVHDELVDAVQRDLLVGRVLDGHRDKRDIGIRRFHHVLARVMNVLLADTRHRVSRSRRIAAVSILLVITAGSAHRRVRRRAHAHRHRRRVPIVRILLAEERVHLRAPALGTIHRRSRLKHLVPIGARE